MPPDPELTAKGWEQRFIADPRMARDAVDTYGDLGYEVKLVPLKLDTLKDECSGCKAILKQFSTVYTRRRHTD